MPARRARFFLTCLAAACVAGVLIPRPATAALDPARRKLLRDISSAFADISKEAMPAVVFVKVERLVAAGGADRPSDDPFDFFGDEWLRRFFGRSYPRGRRYFRQEGQGTGFLISADGYILTNNHVVGDAQRIIVQLQDGRELPAKRIGSDPQSEVAVIKIEGSKFPFLKMGNSSDLRIGEWVIAIGNPFGLSRTVTVGVVSAKGRANVGVADFEDFIQTDAAINPGNSGGPLLNLDGEVIGINTAIYSRSGGYMGIGFAIPIDLAKPVQDQLIRRGRVDRGFLGVAVQDLSPELAASFGLSETRGVLVTGVQPGAAGAKAGLREGDALLQFDGRALANVNAFRTALFGAQPGKPVKLSIIRDGRKVELTALPDAVPGDTAEPADSEAAEWLVTEMGMQLQNLTPDLARRLGCDVGDGVLVAGVAPGGLAWRAGLRTGTLIVGVNRQKTGTIEDFKTAMTEARGGEAAVLHLREGDTTRQLVIMFR